MIQLFVKCLILFQLSKFVYSLSTSDSPKIVQTVLSEPIAEGQYFSVVCSVNQGVLPLFFQWSKNGQVISQTNIKIESLNNRLSQLSIEKVSSSDSGNYTC